MALSKLRVEDISLYNYIKYEVLGYHFIEQLTSQELTYNPTLGIYFPSYEDFVPSPASVGRGWVPFDEASGTIDTSSEQSSRVSVVGASTYQVNYLLGGIKNPDTTPSSVSYYWNYVSVVDGWPGSNPPPLPVVSIDIAGTVRKGLQLGGGHLSIRDVDIHIFATNNAERDDIVDVLMDALYSKSIMLVDYTTGDYLDSDGFFDTSFIRAEYSTSSKLYFENVVSRTINSPIDWTDINRYRSIISFDLISYIG